MSANPHANGGALRRALRMPDFRRYAVPVTRAGGGDAEAARILGGLLRDATRENAKSRNFRVFGPSRDIC